MLCSETSAQDTAQATPGLHLFPSDPHPDVSSWTLGGGETQLRKKMELKNEKGGEKKNQKLQVVEAV